MNIYTLKAFLISAVILLGSASAGFSQTNQLPEALSDVGITEKLGDYIPADVQLTNQDGELVLLGDYLNGGKPFILNLVYYECPSMCNFIMNSLTDTMKELRWTAGKEFDVLTVSMAYDETWELAKENKTAYVNFLNREGAADGWHFFVGEKSEVKRLTDAVGFYYKWDEKSQEYLHASAIIFLSPDGMVSRYLYGMDYHELDVRNALFDAAEGKIGSTLERVLLFCYTYDPDSGSYVPYAMNIMKVGGVITVIGLGLFIGIFWIRERKKTRKQA
ncbi:MAG: SCO family protein [Cyclonatronaceae bacterium]